jgi:hypothetical protein
MWASSPGCTFSIKVQLLDNECLFVSALYNIAKIFLQYNMLTRNGSLKKPLFESLAPEVQLNHGANVGGRLKVNLRLWVKTTKQNRTKRFHTMIIIF